MEWGYIMKICRNLQIYWKSWALSLFLVVMAALPAHAANRGIYISQATAENSKFLTSLINQSKSVGIDTFIIDLSRAGPAYASNIKQVKQAGIRYVARIVVFPKGGTPSEVKSKAYWQRKNDLVQRAIHLGADEIQLDYIRYNTKQRPSDQNAKDVLEVIKYFKEGTDRHGIPLQIDVFGETSFKPSRYIGQDIQVFAPYIDALCPMVYPSHYEPYKKHAKQPYETVFSSLKAIKKQFNQRPPFKVYAWIEMYNYRYKMSWDQRIKYIKAQIKATKDANINGWYAWSPNNQYKVLFEALRGQPIRAAIP